MTDMLDESGILVRGDDMVIVGRDPLFKPGDILLQSDSTDRVDLSMIGYDWSALDEAAAIAIKNSPEYPGDREQRLKRIADAFASWTPMSEEPATSSPPSQNAPAED